MRKRKVATEMTLSGIDYLKQRKIEIDHLLDQYLPPEVEFPQALHRAMRYSVLAGGKRIRPILCLTAYEAFGGKDREIINPAACSLEFMHTYSLIHDDLPCMDDDDLRRGIPTLHKKYGETIAVLAGDALHDLAFNLIARTGSTGVVSELTAATGTSGMLGGQMADIEAEGKSITLDDVKFIHSRKTAALIRASVKIGAILAGIDDATLERLAAYGEKIGLAFQIVDDMLDVSGDQRKLGKKVGSDCKKLKATYPGVTGMEKARKDADLLIDEAVNICREFDIEANHFIFIAHYIGARES
jgi:geranylgeranyl diphosphate synthase type II